MNTSSGKIRAEQDKAESSFFIYRRLGRLLNQYITTSGGVDGNWDNPTHYVWSVFNKPEAATRYGRTVDYYCKYECSLLEPSPDELKNAIDDVSDDEENNKWIRKKLKMHRITLMICSNWPDRYITNSMLIITSWSMK